jgi:hypothetical protein
VKPATLPAALALALAGLGCAHGAAAPAADKGAVPTRALVTGSRIPQPVDPDHPVPVTTSPVRVYTREQVLQTGRPGLGAALADLEPAAR